MQRVNSVVACGLAVVVIVLGILLWRAGRPAGESPGPRETPPTPPPVSPVAAAGPRIERVPDAEAALKLLGYEAWVFRFKGGTVRNETGRDRDVLGKFAWETMRAGKKDPPVLSSASGLLVVQVGPIKKDAEKKRNDGVLGLLGAPQEGDPVLAAASLTPGRADTAVEEHAIKVMCRVMPELAPRK